MKYLDLLQHLFVIKGCVDAKGWCFGISCALKCFKKPCNRFLPAVIMSLIILMKSWDLGGNWRRAQCGFEKNVFQFRKNVIFCWTKINASLKNGSTYVWKFIPDLATITAPLRELICNANKFTWKKEHQRCFEKLQQEISNANTLTFFDNTLRTRVVADASPVVLGTDLVQFAGQHRQLCSCNVLCQ